MLGTREEFYTAIVITSVFAFLLISIIIITAVLYHNRKKRYLQEKARFTRILLESQLEIKEQTLRHIAFELRDNLGQIASLIKINLETLRLDQPATAAEQVEDTKELARQFITDLKSLSLSLNSERAIRAGLVKALEAELQRLNKLGVLHARMVIEGTVAEPDQNTCIIIFRMVQEALNNIVKHSGASELLISMTYTETNSILEIADNGAGFDVEEKLKTGGSGLMNLVSRAKLIQGKLDIESAPTKGTTIRLTLPLPNGNH